MPDLRTVTLITTTFRLLCGNVLDGLFVVANKVLVLSTTLPIPVRLNHLRSWIGSIATFITLSGGALCGRLFDRGYLYDDHLLLVTTKTLTYIRYSHYLIFVGGTLTTFALFMLSLAKPQQYYQVSYIIMTPYALSRL